MRDFASGVGSGSSEGPGGSLQKYAVSSQREPRGHQYGPTHCGIPHPSRGGLAASADIRIRDRERFSFLDARFRSGPPSPAPAALPDQIKLACLFYNMEVDANIRSGSAEPGLEAASRPGSPPHAGPRGSGSLLGRAGVARSGFCRGRNRRTPGPSPDQSGRRLRPRQVPDCLRCPGEERSRPGLDHPRTPAQRTWSLSEGGPAGGAFPLATRTCVDRS